VLEARKARGVQRGTAGARSWASVLAPGGVPVLRERPGRSALPYHWSRRSGMSVSAARPLARRTGTSRCRC